MPKQEPSVLQFEYAKAIGNRITDLLTAELNGLQPLMRKSLTGGGPTDHLPAMPDSMVHQFSGSVGEDTRKLIVGWFREVGVMPS